VFGRDGRNGCREAFYFGDGPRDNLRRLALRTPELRLTVMMMMMMMMLFITTKTAAALTAVIMILLLLGLLFTAFIRYFWRSKE
jgi:hypothetical protein